jgi:hypothetical protein
VIPAAAPARPNKKKEAPDLCHQVYNSLKLLQFYSWAFLEKKFGTKNLYFCGCNFKLEKLMDFE